MSGDWSGFGWGITEATDPTAYEFLGKDENDEYEGERRGWTDPLSRCSDDAYGTEYNYVWVEAAKVEGSMVFKTVKLSGLYELFSLELVPELRGKIQDAREKWEVTRQMYLKKNKVDIGEGRLIVAMGMKT